MAAARAQGLRALLARCSTKCLRGASPSPSPPAAASFSSLPRAAAPSPSAPASRTHHHHHLFPSQTRALASEAARGGGREAGSAGDDEEWAAEWEDSEDDGYEPEVRTVQYVQQPRAVAAGCRRRAAGSD
jgi:hypothetical protein